MLYTATANRSCLAAPLQLRQIKLCRRCYAMRRSFRHGHCVLHHNIRRHRQRCNGALPGSLELRRGCNGAPPAARCSLYWLDAASPAALGVGRFWSCIGVLPGG